MDGDGLEVMEERIEVADGGSRFSGISLRSRRDDVVSADDDDSRKIKEVEDKNKKAEGRCVEKDKECRKNQIEHQEETEGNTAIP